MKAQAAILTTQHRWPKAQQHLLKDLCAFGQNIEVSGKLTRDTFSENKR